MRIQFQIRGRGDFERAEVWVYRQTNSLNIGTCFEHEVRDPGATVEWPSPDGLYKVRIKVYFTWDVIPPSAQDRWLEQVGDLDELVVTNDGKAIAVAVGGRVAPDRWMTELGGALAGRPLGRLLIPGSHDSGSFAAMYKRLDEEKVPLLGVPLPGGYLDVSFVARTQDLDLGQQLAAGIRSFDVRIGRSRRDADVTLAGRRLRPATYYLQHGGTTGPDLELEPQIEKIRAFAESHPREVILLWLRSGPWLFPQAGFERADHLELRAWLVERLGHLIFSHVDRGDRPLAAITVGEIVASGRNLVLLGDEIADDDPRHAVTWPGSRHGAGSWAYTSYVSSAGMTLGARLHDDVILQTDGDRPISADTDRSHPDGTTRFPGFRATVEQLLRRRRDPRDRLAGLLFDVGYAFSTLDLFAAKDTVLPAAAQWTREWETRPDTAGAQNIVSLDYFNHSNIVQLLIRLNQRRT